MLAFLNKAQGLARKAFLVVAVYTIVISFFLFLFNKDKPKEPTYDPIKITRAEIYSRIKDPQYQKTDIGKKQIALYRAGVCGLIGEACTDNPVDGDRNFDHSIFGGVAKLIVLPYANPPASGLYWAYNGLSNAGFVPHTYAAEGVGFAAMKPLLPLWKVFRDVSYLILVLILIAIGFMIMFRTKIDQNTVVNIENSLPRIVITLVLITFSFAIVGFFIDMMYLSSSIVISVLSKNTIFNIDVQSYTNKVFSGDSSSLFDLVFFNSNILQIGAAMFDMMPTIVNWMIRGILTVVVVKLLFIAPGLGDVLDGTIGNVQFTFGLIKSLISVIFGVILGTVVGLLAPLILSLVVLLFTGILVFFRIFFLLFFAYLRIILATIFAPVILLLEAVPGQKAFSKWIKSLLADLATFPIVIGMIIVSTIVTNTGISPSAKPFWQAPFIHSTQSAPGGLTTLIGIGILFMIPDVVKSVKKLIGLKESPFKVGAGLFFGGSAAAGQTGQGILSRYSSFAFGLHYLPGPMKNVMRKVPGLSQVVGPEDGGQKPEHNPNQGH